MATTGSPIPSKRAPSAASDSILTFCRVCEASCGLVAQVEDGRIVAVQGDPGHLASRGHLCKKAMGAVEVTYDPDRVLQPLKRVGGPGEFEPITWRQATREIGRKLALIRREHGEAAFATMSGQPSSNSYATSMWYPVFKKVMRTKWNYSLNAEDAAAYMRASEILYGSVGVLPKPDLWRTDFAIIIGANPLVSHGSLLGEPLLRKSLTGIVERGGRVVVIDPRRTETAQVFEHIGLRAGTDAWLLLAMLREILVHDLGDEDFVAARTANLAELRRLVEDFTPELAAVHCGLSADVISALARDFAVAPSALIYGRTGTCTQQFGTLNNILQNLLCLVTGNVDRPGGMVLPVTPFRDRPTIAATPAAVGLKSRTTGLPAVAGGLPSRALITDITESGVEQVRALMMIGANPLSSSAAAGPAYAAALEQLDLFFSLDFYVTETNRHAHYILPSTTMFEHEDMPFKYLFTQLRPMMWATPAVVSPRGQVRDDWWIMNQICRQASLGGAYESRAHRFLSRLGWYVRPSTLVDRMIRKSETGRKFGLTLKRLFRDYRQGIVLEDELPVGLLAARSEPIDLAPREFADELQRLKAHQDDESYPYRLVGMREILSMNTWMHNVPSLMSSHRHHFLHISQFDAEALQLADGEMAEVTSQAGTVKVPVKVSPRMTPGNVALPHGWGHAGGGRRANAAGGVNSNVLSAKGPADAEVLAGMSVLNGIPVRIRPAANANEAQDNLPGTVRSQMHS